MILFFAMLYYSQVEAQSLTPGQKPVSQNLLLHFNKNTCNAGDTLLFKCYIINSIDHVQEDNNLYILLSDNQGNIISKDKYPVINSGAHGYIPIPKELVSGTYRIEAFTPYMINNMLIKSNAIMVNNPLIKTGNADLNCKVYYDNNRLISNMPNTFFVKTAFAGNIPAAADISITDKDNKEQYRFKTDANGIAKVTFRPLNNQLYNLNINGPGKMYKFPLLKPDSTGVNMFISFDKNILNFTVNKNYKIQNSQDDFTIVAYQKKNEVYKFNLSFETYATVTGGFHVESLHTGVVKLVLLNREGTIISSSSVYLQNDNDFEDIAMGNTTGSAQNKTRFDLSFVNKANQFLSVGAEKTDVADTAVNTGADLDFFYSNVVNSPDADQVVDFFEIAQPGKKAITGRYKILAANVRTLSGNKNMPLIADDYATIIRGKVYDAKGDKPLTNGFLNIYYEAPDTTFNYTANVAADGSFMLDSLVFTGKEKFYYRYFNNNSREINCTVKLAENKTNDSLDSLLVSGFDYKLKREVDKNMQLADTVVTDTKLLNEVKVTAATKSKKQNVNELFATGIYAGQSSIFIDNINFPPGDGFMNGIEFVKNRVPTIAIQNGNFVNTKNFSLQTRVFWVVGVLINEAPSTMYDLNSLFAKDIAMVKFFEAGHIAAGMQNPGGLIAVYTKSDVSNNALNKLQDGLMDKERVQAFEYVGFSDKVNLVKGKTIIPVKNQSVYWNPSVILRKEQNSFSFETEKPEAGKAYKLTIRGYNEAGQLINFESIVKN